MLCALDAFSAFGPKFFGLWRHRGFHAAGSGGTPVKAGKPVKGMTRADSELAASAFCALRADMVASAATLLMAGFERPRAASAQGCRFIAALGGVNRAVFRVGGFP